MLTTSCLFAVESERNLLLQRTSLHRRWLYSNSMWFTSFGDHFKPSSTVAYDLFTVAQLKDSSKMNVSLRPCDITITIGELTPSSFPSGDIIDIAHSSLLELFTHLSWKAASKEVYNPMTCMGHCTVNLLKHRNSPETDMKKGSTS